MFARWNGEFAAWDGEFAVRDGDFAAGDGDFATGEVRDGRLKTFARASSPRAGIDD